MDGAAASFGTCIDSICIGQVRCFQRLQIFKARKKSMRPSLRAFCRLQAVEFSFAISALNLVAIEYAVKCHKISTNFHYLKGTHFSCWEMFLKLTVPYPGETFVSVETAYVKEKLL